ncbi:hypothetical protein RMCBS344292_05603 [Rhizopus microsporus]|nr:hypothetical protein RMCBS344292_05603 [Rhizopus microsporus]
MSKRSNEETVVKEDVNKRSKTESHAPDCTDETCTGCDIGEVEIAFTNKTDDGEVEEVQPNAHELMVLAIDEAQEGDNDMARRLFDMSLEKFQQDEPDNRTGYAACLVQLGKTIGVEESLREGLDILRGEKNKDSTLKLKVAYAALALANYLRMQQIAAFAPQEANLYQENAELDEDAYEELLSKQKVTPDEEKLYKEAIGLVREAIKDAPLSDIQNVISELRTYALSLDLPVQKDHANVVLDATIEFIQQVPGHQDNWELVTVWAACLAHQEKVVDGTQKRVEYPFHKPAHGDHIIFRDEFMTGHVQLPFSAFCTCPERAESTQQQQQQQQKQLSVSYLTNPSSSLAPLPRLISKSEEIMTDRYSVRPYTHIRPNTTINNITTTATTTWSPEPIHSHRSSESSPGIDVVMEPKQRGFYYEDGRITREPPLLQRYAEQGVLTQASLLRKRKKHTPDLDYHELSVLPPKKPKIPHRHGEFKQRRDDIISRMRTVMITDLEQKAQRLPEDFSLAIEQVSLPDDLDADQLNADEAGRLLMPALMILTHHSNMKPHLDNGMNQNGIYYNNDYFRLYLAFVQFQNIFARLFPNEIIKIATPSSLEDEAESPVSERDKDRERNVNMKAYRVWIEPRLTETNWAAFRRNVMVGERMMQLTKVILKETTGIQVVEDEYMMPIVNYEGFLQRRKKSKQKGTTLNVEGSNQPKDNSNMQTVEQQQEEGEEGGNMITDDSNQQQVE